MIRSAKVFIKTRSLINWINYAFVLVACTMAIYHFVYAQVFLQGPIKHQNTFLGFAILVVLLSYLKRRPNQWPIVLPLMLLGVACVAYIGYFYDELEVRAGFPTSLDVIIGSILLPLVFFVAWRGIGPALPLLALLFVFYCSFGQYLPPPLQSMSLSYSKIMSNTSIGLKGIFSMPLNIASTYIFLFMIYAGLMQSTGAVKFFDELGKLVGRKFRSGPAMAAVVTSALVGSISGSAGANVAVTGSFTIPAMKRVGYKPEQAGGIEAAASTSGPIVPPVMGVAAFLMAGFTGIPYAKIISVAALPALLYVFSAGIHVQLRALKQGIQPLPEEVNYKELLLRLPQFLIPFLLIIFLFVRQHSPMYVSFWACITLLAVSFLRQDTRPTLRQLVDGMTDGALLGAKVGTNCACIGIVVSTVIMCGLGLRLPMIIGNLVGHNFFLLLIFIGALAIFLGCGLPPSASYMLVVIVLAPTLSQAGIPLLASHFFVFFFANFAFITPPIGVAAVFASQIAGASYMKTSLEAVKVGIAGFIIPFLFIFCPALIFDFSKVFHSMLMILGTIISLLCFQATFTGYFISNAYLLMRGAFLLCALVIEVYIFTSNWLAYIIALSIFILLVFLQVVKKRGLFLTSNIVADTNGVSIQKKRI